jgi:hypothetical protein
VRAVIRPAIDRTSDLLDDTCNACIWRIYNFLLRLRDGIIAGKN